MRQIFILDGHNIILRCPDWAALLDRSHEQARDKLVAFCAGWRSRRRDVDEFIVVFDGHSAFSGGSGPRPVGVRVVFSSGDKDADDKIVELASKTHRGDRCTVVTDDRALANRARGCGASVMPGAQFRGTLKSASRRGSVPAESKTGLTPLEEDEITRALKEMLKQRPK